MHGGNVRIAHMRDHRNARRPEARIVGGAGNLRAEFGREFAMHRRAMHADLLEQPSVHHRHHAAAAGLAAVVGAVPRRAHEAPRLTGIERGRRVVLQPFEGRANVVAQGFEPAPRPRLAILDHGDVHLEFLTFILRHCERSEAIHGAIKQRLDGFVADAPRNDDAKFIPAARNSCSSRCNCRGER